MSALLTRQPTTTARACCTASSATVQANPEPAAHAPTSPANSCTCQVRTLQRQGLHTAAEAMARHQLSLPASEERDTWLYLLALSLDAQGRQTEAAACYAMAIDAVVAELLTPASV